MKGVPFSFAGEGYCVIGETALILPEERFAFTWIEQDDEAERWFMNTIVNLHLVEIEDCTHLTLVHDGLNYLPEEIREGVCRRFVMFWQESGIKIRLLKLISISIISPP